MQLECSTCAPLHAGPNPTHPADPTNPNDAFEELGEGQFITKVSFTAQSLVERAIGKGHCVFCRLIFCSLCEVLGRGMEPQSVHDPIVVERHDVGAETGPMVVKFGPASARRELQIYSLLSAFLLPHRQSEQLPTKNAQKRERTTSMRSGRNPPGRPSDRDSMFLSRLSTTTALTSHGHG